MQRGIVEEAPQVSLIVGFIGLVLLSLLKRTIISAILVCTTVFPLVLFADVQDSRSNYSNFLSLLAHVFYRTSLEEATTSQMFGLFFTVIFLISIVFTGIEYLSKKLLGINYKVGIIQILLFMSVAYLLTSINYYLKRGNDGSFSLILVFYLFNMFSLFSYRTINIGIKELKEKVKVLNYIPF